MLYLTCADLSIFGIVFHSPPYFSQPLPPLPLHFFTIKFTITCRRMGNVLWKRHVFGVKALKANKPPIRFFATPKHKRKKGQPPEVLTPLYKAPLYAMAGLGNVLYRGVKNSVLAAAYNMYPMNVVVANRTEKLWRKRRTRWENAAVKVTTACTCAYSIHKYSSAYPSLALAPHRRVLTSSNAVNLEYCISLYIILGTKGLYRPPGPHSLQMAEALAARRQERNEIPGILQLSSPLVLSLKRYFLRNPR